MKEDALEKIIFMKLFCKLTTSEKISLSFTLVSFFSIFVFLLLINISYFFIWYTQQKEMVFSGMNETYKNYLDSNGQMKEVEAFKTFLLSKDTLIIPEVGDPICSPGVAKKVRMEIGEMQERFFYKDGEIIYVVYAQFFPHVGNVKVFFDTTPYITSQMIILKIGFLFLGIIVFFQFFLGKYITRTLLRDLKQIAENIKNVNIYNHKNSIKCHLPEKDEIYVLAQALNTSYSEIDIQTQKLKQFLTDVSHEFKTPLMVMNSKLDVLEKRMEQECLGKNDVSHFFESSRKNIKKLNGLIESLFFLSQVENTSPILQKKSVDISDFMLQKKQEYLEIFPEKHIEMKLDISPNLKYELEEQSFSILIDNLVHNAVKFCETSPVLIFTARKDYFSLTDNGIGIATEDQTKIFERYYRKDTNREGFGIGLSLVARICEIYRWRIEIESELGKGSEFRIVL